ncbi:MAG: hypothetical protein RIR00_1844, partial [Pseudomonadota bacterium]
MLNNLKIGTRLVLAFGSVLVLLIALSLLAISRIGELNHDISGITNDRMPKIEMSAQMVENTLLQARSVRNLILAEDKPFEKQQLELIGELRRQNSEILNKIEPMVNSVKGKELFSQLKSQRERYAAAVDQLLPIAYSASPQYNPKKATEFVLGEYSKTANAYVEALKHFQNFQKESAEKAGREAEELAASGRTLVLAIALFAVLLTGGIALLVTRSITRPTAATVDAARKMSEGDFNFKLENSDKDELGELSRTIIAVQQTVQLLITEMNRMSREHDAGEIDARIDEGRFRNDFQVMAHGVNEMVFGHIALNKKAMACVTAFGEGNMDAVLESFPGKKRFINETVEQVRRNIKALVDDAKLLAAAAVEGKLATRADASKHQGDFRRIVEGVNQTLDAVIGPLNVAANYVDRISKGDVPDKITDRYNGDFNTIKNNLNTCIDAVNRMIADARMLSQAAVEGRLATRADASLHQGDFRRIVEGVNQTLDAVIGPLNVAANYVDRIAKGDIPPKITDNYNGDFNAIKNNLNTCITAVNALVTDANLLSAAAVAGKLETRADASKHQGDFQKIVAGVNQTLDAVIEPINDVQRVMGAMERGDMTQTISRAYQGDFAVLKEAINNTIAKLSETIAQIISAADALTNASGQVSATAQSLSQSSSEQAASVEETSASLEQMTA